jgi:hypothetical protein
MVQLVWKISDMIVGIVQGPWKKRKMMLDDKSIILLVHVNIDINFTSY